jgi:hydroxypyruvate reductase
MDDPSEAARGHLRLIYGAAVRAVEPSELIRRYVRREGERASVDAAEVAWLGSVVVVGAGKAAARMASGCETALGAQAVRGVVVVPDGFGTVLRSIRVAEASHPLPDERALEATAEICRLLESTVDEPVICLISGGASSLLVRPRAPLTLADKQETTRLLLSSGASIQEVNTVRKHLSQVKGGGLLRHARSRPVVSLILSDVVGDDPSMIGSGPTAADPTSFADAMDVLGRFALDRKVPATVRSLLERGMRGAEPETVKPGDAELLRVANVLIGTNLTALQGAAQEARRLGYRTVVLDEPLTGDTTECARTWTAEIDRRMGFRGSAPSCVVAGGETTVAVRGAGRGGRNQEFALAAVEALADREAIVLSAGTDGIDGPTPAAGAFVDGGSLARARSLGLDPERFLRENDSHSFFAALDDLFCPGPTGTNVMDIKIALRPGSAANTPVLQD